MKKGNNCIRIDKIILTAIVLLFAAIIAKLLFIVLSPTVDGIDLEKFALSRTTAKKTLIANRGTIYDSLGEILAQDIRSYTVIAYLESSRTKNEDKPRHVIDKDYTAQALSPVLNMSKEYILGLLNRNAYQVELGPGGRDITELVKQEIEALELPGIDFIKSTKRTYPYEDFASYIIGFAQKGDDQIISGKMGIEAKYDKELKGKDGAITYQKDAYGYQIANTPEFIDESIDGYDIYLTIDSNIQMYLQNAIHEIENIGVDFATITIADAKSGAIVGTATSPSFNPNVLTITNYNNPLTSITYEPGSTMKIFSFMAAIEEGLYDGTKTYQSGSVVVDNYKISDWNKDGWGTITFDKGFTYSSNTAAIRLAKSLGKRKLADYYENFGFGNETGIELPNEYYGKIEMVSDSEVAAAAYGQGIATTPIQNIQALTTLTNKGVLLKPYIISKIVNKNTNEIIYDGKRTEVRRVVSENTVNKMIELLDETVNSEDNAVTGHKYKTDALRLIGKTGTAQYAGSDGKYVSSTNANIRSFSGIFPKNDPKYIIYISLKNFNSTSNVMAKILTSVVESIAKYENIDQRVIQKDTTSLIKLENYLNELPNDVEINLKSLGLNPIIIGDGDTIIKQFPSKNQTVLTGSKVFLLTNSTSYKMPDVKYWTNSEIIALANMINIDYNIDGFGRVISTSIDKDVIIDLSQMLYIKLENGGIINEES